MRQFVDQLLGQIRISHVVGKQVSLKPQPGGEHLGLCPFHHEKTPSFTVSDAKNFYHCFGCGAHGNAISFVMETSGLSFLDAVKQLANEAGMSIPQERMPSKAETDRQENMLLAAKLAAAYYHAKLHEPIGKQALEYLLARGLSNATIEKFQLGYAPADAKELWQHLTSHIKDTEAIFAAEVLKRGKFKDPFNLFHERVIFPIHDQHHNVIAFGGRSLNGKEPKYLNSPENPLFHKGHELFALNFARRSAFQSKCLMLVEGYMDVISLHNAGIENAVAPLGTAVKMEQIKLLWQVVDQPTICLDSDRAGKKAAIKLATQALSALPNGKSLQFIDIQGAKDPDEVMAKFGAAHMQKLINSATPLSAFLFHAFTSVVNRSIPEEIASVKKELLQLANTLPDKDLQDSYRRFFLDQLFNWQRNRSNKKNAPGDINNIVLPVSEQHSLALYKILCIFWRYVPLLEDNYLLDELVKLEIDDKALDSVRNQMLAYPIYRGSVIENDELLFIDKQMRLSIYYSTCCEDAHMKGFLKNTSTLSEARESLVALFDVQTLHRIIKQTEELAQKLRLSPDEELFAQLRHLNIQKEKLNAKLGLSYV